MISQQMQRAQRSRSRVAIKNTFYGALLLRLKLEESHAFKTAATDGVTIFFNPAYVDELTDAKLDGLMEHEALHPALLHNTRMHGRDPELWNMACDYQVNPMVTSELPDGALFRDDLGKIGADKAYRILLDERQQQQEQQQDDARPDSDDTDSSQGGDQGEDQSSAGDTDDTGAGDDGEPSDDEASDSTESSGDGADGAGDSAGTDSQDYGGCGEVLPAPVASEAERADFESQWRVALSQAVKIAGAGNIPAHVREQVNEILEPRADWRELLRRYMDDLSNLDYSWTRQNRRFVANGLYLPTLHSEQMPPFAFVIDASYSMPREALQQALGEFQQACEVLQPEYVDLYIHTKKLEQVIRFERGEPIEVESLPRGGTCFAPVCEALDDADDQYAVAVWLTDMDAFDWDECQEPACPVLFLDFDDNRFGCADGATFGDVIGMSDV